MVDVKFRVSLYRTVKRSVIRAITKEPLWHDNKESFVRMFSKNSIIKFALFSLKRKRRRYSYFMNDKYKDKNWIKIRNKSELKKFWGGLKYSSDKLNSSDE